MKVYLTHKNGEKRKYINVKRFLIHDPSQNNFPTIHLTLEDGGFKGFSPFDWILEIVDDDKIESSEFALKGDAEK